MSVAHAQGYQMRKCTLDERQNVIEEAYLADENQPFVFQSGYSVIQYGYDQWNQIKRISYLDGRYTKIINTDLGYHCVRWELDGRQKLRESYFDQHEIPIDPGCGYAAIEWIYDDQNGLAQEVHYDTAGKPID